ncbi:MAG TPA: hypothetical protein VL460_05080 [Caulobacteraceae bacterium]|jgi:hypothetical protein|nr:hypothetical protein [Caulobacteraceae bacterium]
MFNWLENNPIANWVASSSWAYPFLLTAHGLGMAVVVGLTAVIALRILGFPRRAPLGAYKGLMGYLLAGFLVNAGSGAVLFLADPVALAANLSFQIKMASIVVGVIVLWRMHVKVLVPAAAAEAPVAQGSVAADGVSIFAPPRSAKALAIAAVLIWWLSVIVSGRLVAYLSQAA